jgi:hypothetical protein
MPHGYPDWGLDSGDLGLIDQDLTELAARLGGLFNYGTGGKTIYIDDFSHSFSTWQQVNNAHNSVAVSSNETGELYEGCLRITADAGFTPDITLRKFIVGLPRNRMGFEVTFADGIGNSDVKMIMEMNIPSGRFTATLHYHNATHLLSVYDSAGVDALNQTVLWQINSKYLFNRLKFVADFNTLKYGLVYFNEQSFDASAIAFQSAAGGYTGDSVKFQIDVVGADIVRPTYLGHVAITRNEP